MPQNPTSLRRLESNRDFKRFQVPLFLRLFTLLTLIICAANAQSPGTCQATALPPPVRAEGLTEPVGAILISCAGFRPGAQSTGNFTVSLPVNVTNRVDANGLTTQAVLSIDYGSGLTPSGIPAAVSGRVISFNGVQVTAPASGSFMVQITGIRAAVNPLSASMPLLGADLSAPLILNNTHVTVGNAVPGLYATLASAGIACTGSPLPTALTLTNLFAAGTTLASTRLTEGFGAAFSPRGTGEDSGTRFVVSYAGIPANGHLYLPDFVAGSDAAQPTNGGDLGGSPTVGQYLPGSGTLLLARVPGADSTGAGGVPLPPPSGPGIATLDSVTEVLLASGAGYAVYEVVDANPNLVEHAQFPTFVGLPAGSPPAVAQESLSIGPVSAVTTASMTDPIPRFAATAPGSDCSVSGDCQASYFPRLSVSVAGPIQLTAVAGGAMTSQPGYIPVGNAGGGTMIWNIAVNYLSGSGWIHLDQPASLINNGSVRVFAQPAGLAAGTYQANIVINAGSQAGTQSIPVTLTVQAPPPPPPAPTVIVSKIVNAATFASAPLVPGSVATLQGSHLSGTNVTVTVGGQPAALLFTSDTQINFVVPAGLSTQGSADVVVTADGVSSTPVAAVLAAAYPALFAHGIRNSDWTENTAATPAAGGSVLQIFGTGIPAGASVSAQIGNQMNLVPVYAGPAPNVPGVQQVNLAIPSRIAPGTTQLVLCASVNGQPYCSGSYTLAVD